MKYPPRIPRAVPVAVGLRRIHRPRTVVVSIGHSVPIAVATAPRAQRPHERPHEREGGQPQR